MEYSQCKNSNGIKLTKNSPLLIKELIAISFVLSSCSMSKKIPYFKDLESSNEEIPVVHNEPVIHNDDMLSIVISSIDPITVRELVSDAFGEGAVNGSVITGDSLRTGNTFISNSKYPESIVQL